MRAALLFLAVLAVGACDNMVRQRRFDTYGETNLFADGKVEQAPPDGTVARDTAQIVAEEQRPPMSLALLQRGAERYRIYCSMCHGADGSGEGTVTARGFPRPAAFDEPAQRALQPERIFAAISNGHGVMYGFADRVPAGDRWAMTAYVRALGQGSSR